MPLTITNTRPEHIAQLAAHQQLCFPTLDPNAWMREEHFAAHLRVFPEGQHVALDGEQVIGQSSTFRISGAIALQPHRFIDITGGGFFGNHDPGGEWLYGADMSIHPAYRGRGLSKALYNARKNLIRQLGLRGMVAGGQMPGFHHYRGQLPVEAYIERVVHGELNDPTLTPQLRSGFSVCGVLHGYLDDAEHGDEAALIVWENL